MAFGLTPTLHGSDATWLETHAESGRRTTDHQRCQAIQHGVHTVPHPHLILRSRHVRRSSHQPGQITALSWCPPTRPGFPGPLLTGLNLFPMPSLDHGEGRLQPTCGARPTRCSASRSWVGGPRRRSCSENAFAKPSAVARPSTLQRPWGRRIVPGTRKVCLGKHWSPTRPSVAAGELQTEAQMGGCWCSDAPGTKVDRNQHMGCRTRFPMATIAQRLVCDARRSRDCRSSVASVTIRPTRCASNVNLSANHVETVSPRGSEEIQDPPSCRNACSSSAASEHRGRTGRDLSRLLEPSPRLRHRDRRSAHA